MISLARLNSQSYVHSVCACTFFFEESLCRHSSDRTASSIHGLVCQAHEVKLGPMLGRPLLLPSFHRRLSSKQTAAAYTDGPPSKQRSVRKPYQAPATCLVFPKKNMEIFLKQYGNGMEFVCFFLKIVPPMELETAGGNKFGRSIHQIKLEQINAGLLTPRAPRPPPASHS